MKRIFSGILVMVMLIMGFGTICVTAVTANDIVNEAYKWIGTPYGSSDGRGGPGSLVDCSGLTKQVYGKFGCNLYWHTTEQAKCGTYVDKNNMQPGDLVCMSHSNGTIGHVGIYIGGGQMIHASSGQKKVTIGKNILTWTYQNAGCRVEYGRRLITLNGNSASSGSSTPAMASKGISNPNQVIRYGQSGAAVSELQRSLNQLIGANLSVDGKFGDKTLAAVKQFQSKYGLAVDGDAGSKTNGKINELIGGSAQSSKPTTAVPSAPVATSKGISNPNQVIRYGQSGAAVSELQRSLNQLIGANLSVDGKFGDKTIAAVKQFQSKYGLAVDGDAGPKTNGKINELLNPSAHVHSYGTNYEAAHPHREYRKCNCGDVQYTGTNRKVEGCQECYPPVHVHSYETYYETAHPHKEYRQCSCGEREYTGKNRKIADCEECYPPEPAELRYHANGGSNKPAAQQAESGDTITLSATIPVRSGYQFMGWSLTKNGAAQWQAGERFRLEQDTVLYAAWEPEEDDYISTFIPANNPKRILKLQIGIPQMSVDGVRQEIDPGRGTVPIIQNDRTLLPIRAVAESFGAYVIWNETEEKVTIYKDDITMEFWIGSRNATVNRETYQMDAAPIVINDRTYMPLRFIAENLGLTVGWNEANQMVTIEGEI